MSTIKELLEKQAAFVKTQSAKLKEAELLEKRAKQLRAEANKPAKIDFKAIRKAKDERLDKFAKALYSVKVKPSEDLLASNGWTKDGPVTQQSGEIGNVWVNPKKPNIKIEIKGSDFIVYKNDAVELEAPLSYLQDYLKK
jgi:hypothetical protein